MVAACAAARRAAAPAGAWRARARPRACAGGGGGGGAPPPRKVPAWKAKQAAREAFMAQSQAATAAAQEAYRSRTNQAAGQTNAAAALPEGCPALAALPFVEYLTPEGALQDVSPPAGSATGASLYAIFDASEALHFVGLSRDIMASLRAHLARTPEETHLLKVTHFGRGVRRDELEAASAAWVHEAGGAVGMDGGAVQRAWEGAIDVGPLMDAEDRAAVAATAEGSKERRLALKVACRKVEAQLKAVLKARNVTEPIRYDPKLKDKGLVDIKRPPPPRPPGRPPTTKPAPAAKKAPPVST